MTSHKHKDFYNSFTDYIHVHFILSCKFFLQNILHTSSINGVTSRGPWFRTYLGLKHNNNLCHGFRLLKQDDNFRPFSTFFFEVRVTICELSAISIHGWRLLWTTRSQTEFTRTFNCSIMYRWPSLFAFFLSTVSLIRDQRK